MLSPARSLAGRGGIVHSDVVEAQICRETRISEVKVHPITAPSHNTLFKVPSKRIHYRASLPNEIKARQLVDIKPSFCHVLVPPRVVHFGIRISISDE
jgi:hypothetical protein